MEVHSFPLFLVRCLPWGSQAHWDVAGLPTVLPGSLAMSFVAHSEIVSGEGGMRIPGFRGPATWLPWGLSSFLLLLTGSSPSSVGLLLQRCPVSRPNMEHQQQAQDRVTT